MKKALIGMAPILIVGSVAFWLLTGSNPGWTKTSVVVKTVDDITGIEAVNYQKKFIPGVDFLGAAFLLSGMLVGISFLFHAKTTTSSKMNQSV